MEVITIGSRRSALALYQANLAKDCLEASEAGLRAEIKTILTQADKMPEARVAAMGGKGIFVKEIEDALLDGSVDIAVHSLKDVPAALPDGLELSCFFPRTDPRDALLSLRGDSIAELPYNALLGTSSPRRAAWALHMRPDLRVVPFRGNVETRIRKLQDGDVDATFLAAAGLKRLGIWDKYAHLVSPVAQHDCIPAVGQGIIAVESRIGDERVAARLRRLNCRTSEAQALCERAFLAQFGEGSCTQPIGAVSSFAHNHVSLHAFAASLDGGLYIRRAGYEPSEKAERLGARLGEKLRKSAIFS